MVTKFDVGDTVLVPMEVSKIDINKKSEITYKLECKALDSSKKEKDYVLFLNEDGIVAKLDNDVTDNPETQLPDNEVGDTNE